MRLALQLWRHIKLCTFDIKSKKVPIKPLNLCSYANKINLSKMYCEISAREKTETGACWNKTGRNLFKCKAIQTSIIAKLFPLTENSQFSSVVLRLKCLIKTLRGSIYFRRWDLF